MAEQKIEIRYKCLHQSCQIKGCREGVLSMDEALFNQLAASYEDRTHLKTPRGYCRLGFPQTLKVLELRRAGHEDDVQPGENTIEKGGPDPIEILKGEHQIVLKKLDLIEQQVRSRDIDGLWISTAEVEDGIHHHSIEKEEFVLFPLLEKVSPYSASEIAIMKEDHRELIALLDSFRNGLKEGDINDSISNSILSNLRNHIAKEDNEFFDSVIKVLDAEGKKILLDGMVKADESHVVIEAGDRFQEAAIENDSDSDDRERFNEALLAAKKASKDDECCH
ncbi:MAG: hypothetical protein A2035_01495 [Nitrospirae bacterium GWA2_42_11]|nr:MAG: hypothetical protein A2035_01495 [Nitrospirae bacterium GWA2_42_11]